MYFKHCLSAKWFYRLGASLLLLLPVAGTLASTPQTQLELTGQIEPLLLALAEPTPRLREFRLSVLKPPAPNPFGSTLVALGNTSLDEIRGGFELADTRLTFSFGIERAVFINGELASTTVLNLRDLQGIVGMGQAPVAVIDGLVGVIQNGSGNSVPLPLSGNLIGTVIQNTLNNQNLQTVTTINAVVNSAQVLRAMSVQTAIQNGVVNSLRR